MTVFPITLAGFLLGGIGLAFAKPSKQRWTKFFWFFAIVHGVIGMMAMGWSIALVTGILILSLVEITRAYKSGGRAIPSLLSLVLVGVFLLFFVSRTPAEPLIFAYIVICGFDGFSQISGQLIGRHRITPTLSPGKTLEGFIGGWLVAVTMSLLLRNVASLRVVDALAAGTLISFASLAGDLWASRIKRVNGLKDFGTLIPGHGGCLDRFDSFLFAAPAFLFFEVCKWN